MKRYLESFIIKDLADKIVLLTGPRQCGKTTISQQLDLTFDYFAKYFPGAKCIQLVKNLDKGYSNQAGYKVCNLVQWLAEIDKHIN